MSAAWLLHPRVLVSPGLGWQGLFCWQQAGTRSEQPETAETCGAGVPPWCPVEVFVVFARGGKGMGERLACLLFDNLKSVLLAQMGF